ncbi:MAG: single-stranded DNA-binding protein [Phycisphaerales bacterium]|nr:single-stranded DNA-binding protein [Phycisphaerales bacterium]
MANSYNKVILMGNLTRDLELRYTPNNTAVANFGVAVNREWKSPDGQKNEEVTFVDCEAWGKQAEIMSQYLSKGRKVFLEGRLKLDTWKDKTDGSNRSKLKVVVEEFRFVDSKPGAGGAGGGGGNEGDEGSGYSGGGGAAGGGGRGQRSGGYSNGGGGGAGGGGRPAPANQPAYEPVQEDDIPF